jgi:hypothetical protein
MSLPTVVAQLTPVSGGYVYQPTDVTGLHRDDGSPSQHGDILSAQPDGTLQTRPATAVGPWEILTIQGPYFVFTTGGGTKTVLVLPPGL